MIFNYISLSLPPSLPPSLLSPSIYPSLLIFLLLYLKFQEIGGLSAAMRQRDDREELIKEVKKLRDRNTELEKDRAKVQTQVRERGGREIERET